MNTVLAITDPGDEIIFPVPYYFNHEMAVVMASGRAVAVPTTADHQLDLDAIAAAITPRTRAVVTVSPNNPTGAVYPADALRAVNALCRDRGIFHIHDEAYEYFTYDGVAHFSPGSIDDASGHTISLFSMSKAYGMASWRVGYMVIPDGLWLAINKVQDTLLICAPAISQRAGIAALLAGPAYARPHLTGLAGTRAYIYQALSDPAVPCDVPLSQGAFYFFIRVETAMPALALTEHLIREHGVAVLPGSAFGATVGCFLRVSYGALDDETAREGTRRLVAGLKGLPS